MEDDSIYNAIIVSLIIGIIVVIITLIVARPEPETFTELYFNDHKTLPKYVEKGEIYPYSFTIANHETMDKTYNYTITKELYEFDYGCEASNLYFEEKQSSIYEMFIKGNYSIPTRTSEPRDPALIIKEDDYSASFNYRIRSGAGQIVIKFQSPTKEKYAVVISGKKAYLLEFEEDKIRIRNYDIDVKEKELNSVNIFVNNGRIKLHIGGKIIFNSKIKDYTSGSFAFETTKTYAEITSFVIGKNQIKQNVNIKFDDMEYETVELETKNYRGKDKYELYKSYLKGKSSAKTVNFISYMAEKEIELNEYTLESIFRVIKGNKVSLGLNNSFEIIYNEDKNEAVIAWQSPKGLRIANKNVRRGMEWHKISVDINKNKAKIYFDYQLIKEIDDLKVYSYNKPFMRAYDSGMSIRDFSAKSNIKPYIIRYTIPVESQQEITYAEIPDKAILQLAKNIMFNATSIAEKEMLRELFEAQKTKWENYRITANYIDTNRNSTVILSFNEIDKVLYSLSIDDKHNKIEINYQKDGEQKIIKEGLLTETLYHKIDMDINKNTLSIKIDNMDVFEEEIDQASDGVLLLDYPEELRFAKLQIEDKDSNKVRILRTQEPGCRPILLKEGSFSKNILVQNEKSKIINGNIPFNEHFDIAKVQISLENEQEIHFWVTKI